MPLTVTKTISAVMCAHEEVVEKLISLRRQRRRMTTTTGPDRNDDGTVTFVIPAVTIEEWELEPGLAWRGETIEVTMSQFRSHCIWLCDFCDSENIRSQI